jgi:hypothetical protein
VRALVGGEVRFTAQGSNLGSVSWTTTPAGTPATGNGTTFTTKFSSPGLKQVRASCGATSAAASATVIAVTPVLTPRDNFAGRSAVRFGVGEIIDLSFTATPATTAAQLGGLRWFIVGGGGALTDTAGNDGKGVYTAGNKAEAVTLALKVVSGPAAGTSTARKTITIVAPTDALMVQRPGTGLSHTTGTWSVGFLGNIFLRPTDVSFAEATFQEGTAIAVASGYLSSANGQVHPVGSVITLGPGNAATGSQLNGFDTVQTDTLPPPFAVGDFLWAIPWRFGVTGTAPSAVFTTANHHETADATGRATIEKKGAGPFSRVPADPTSTF